VQISLPKLWDTSWFATLTPQYGESAEGRLANAKIIVNSFLSAGFPIGIALAALVNAQHESRLSNNAVGDSGESIGLFQLRWSEAGLGAGAGMTVSERMDPQSNTDRIIVETQDYGTQLMEAYNAGASLATLSVIFGRDIERPADASGRDDTARKMFGPLADMPANQLVLAGLAGTLLITGIVLTLSLGGLYLLWRYKKGV